MEDVPGARNDFAFDDKSGVVGSDGGTVQPGRRTISQVEHQAWIRSGVCVMIELVCVGNTLRRTCTGHEQRQKTVEALHSAVWRILQVS